MSFDWYRWAKSQKGLSPPEKAVLVTIADYFNDEKGAAWPAQDTLAEDTSYSRATIHRACKSLRQRGLLTWSKSLLPSGHFSSNRYVLHRVADRVVATSHEAKEETAMLQIGGLPCSTAQQKPLDNPLKTTLNNTRVAKNKGMLSNKQKILAEKKANQLLKAYPNQYFQLSSLLKDCEDFLLSDQREEDWKNIGNGLPNPFS